MAEVILQEAPEREHRKEAKEATKLTTGIEEAEADSTHSNLIVNYLPLSYRERHIRKIFSNCGHINSCRVMRFAQDGRTLSKGYGFVQFSTRAEAEYAVRALNGKNVLGKKLKVSFAKPSGQRMKSNLFVSQIPEDWTEEHLVKIFSPHGALIEQRILRNLDGTSRKAAFVRFDSNDQACKAIKALNNQKPLPGMDQPLIVRPSNSDTMKAANNQKARVAPSDVDKGPRPKVQRNGFQPRQQKPSSQANRPVIKMQSTKAHPGSSERSRSYRKIDSQRKPNCQKLPARNPYTPARSAGNNYCPRRRIEHPMQGRQDSRGHLPSAPPTDQYPIHFQRQECRNKHQPVMHHEQARTPWRDARQRRPEPQRNEIERFYPNGTRFRQEAMVPAAHFKNDPARPRYTRWHSDDRQQYAFSRYNMYGGSERGRSHRVEDVEFSYTRTPSPASSSRTVSRVGDHGGHEEALMPNLYETLNQGREVMFTHFPAYLDDMALRNMCGAYGEIDYVHVDKDLNGRNIGVAKVVYRDPEAAKNAVKAFNGCFIGGMEIRCCINVVVSHV